MRRKKHWEKLWSNADPLKVSWYQESPDLSLRLVDATGIGRDARILDVGGGASPLVDALLDRGFEAISVIDICDSALAHARARIGARSSQVTWWTGDVTTFTVDRPVDLWHDRAVLHFMTEHTDRGLYVKTLSQSLAPEGHVIIATFALDGPRKCSGLDVLRYGSREISELFGDGFRLHETVDETHFTPGNIEQRFTYFRLQRRR